MEPAKGQSEQLSGSVLDVTDLVEYQEGAIVSRTLLEGESSTVTVFALDACQAISEHSAPHDALLQVLDGTGRVTIDGEPFDLTAGEALVLSADVPHAVDAPAQFTMLLTMIR